MTRLILFITITLFLVSCSNKKGDKTNEGVITYEITYPQEVEENGLSAFLPEEMTTLYKGNDFKMNVKGELSMFNLDYISRSNGDTCFTLFRIFDKKLYYPQKESEKFFLFNKVGEPQLTFYDDSIKNIAGLECKMGTITFNKQTLASKFYYTDELDFELNNMNSPFNNVPGTLMEFTINYQGLNLSFKAQSVKLKHIENDEFAVPSNYRQTSSDEINEIISSLMQLR